MWVICGRPVVLSGYSGFLRQKKWPTWYNWNIGESWIKHHNPTQPHSSMMIDNVKKNEIQMKRYIDNKHKYVHAIEIITHEMTRLRRNGQFKSYDLTNGLLWKVTLSDVLLYYLYLIMLIMCNWLCCFVCKQCDLLHYFLLWYLH